VLTVAGTSYATSLAEQKIRGLVGSTFLLGATSSLLVANLSGFFSLVVYSWRFMISIGLIPPIILFFVSIFLPESPIWRSEKKEKKPMNILPKIRKIISFKVLWRFFLCFLLILSLNLGGLVPVIIYLPITLKSAGLTNFYEIIGGSLGIACWNILTSLIAVFFVDCFGRKLLLGVGYIFMFFSTLTFGFIVMFVPNPWSGIISIFLVLIFLIGNNGGVNAIIYFIFNELFDPEIVIVTSAMNLTMLNFVSFVVGWGYLPLKSVIGLPAMLWIFSGVTLFCGVFLMIFLPETKPRKNQETKTENIPNEEELHHQIPESEDVVDESNSEIKPQQEIENVENSKKMSFSEEKKRFEEVMNHNAEEIRKYSEHDVF
jgi:MFS family permease